MAAKYSYYQPTLSIETQNIHLEPAVKKNSNPPVNSSLSVVYLIEENLPICSIQDLGGRFNNVGPLKSASQAGS